VTTTVALPRPGSSLLSDADRRLIAHLAAGLTAKEIARRTGRSRNAVALSVSRLLAKTGTSNAAHLVATALRCGWLDGGAYEAAA